MFVGTPLCTTGKIIAIFLTEENVKVLLDTSFSNFNYFNKRVLLSPAAYSTGQLSHVLKGNSNVDTRCP